jgi:hypothetical protein
MNPTLFPIFRHVSWHHYSPTTPSSYFLIAYLAKKLSYGTLLEMLGTHPSMLWFFWFFDQFLIVFALRSTGTNGTAMLFLTYRLSWTAGRRMLPSFQTKKRRINVQM